MTAKNAIATSADTEPAASAAPARAFSSPESPRALRRIQTIMNVTMPTATAPMTVSRPSCWLLRKLLVEQLEGDADHEADRDRGRDAEPHRAQRVAAPFLAQKACNDPHDQRRFDAFAQTDDERRQHGL